MERPIIFSTEMVQAILEGRKTQTRRVIKPSPHICHNGDILYNDSLIGSEINCRKGLVYEELNDVCPYGKIGDFLWVRETWGIQGNKEFKSIKSFFNFFEYEEYNNDEYWKSVICYKASDGNICKWWLSIYMPKKYARIFLEITDIKIEKLHDISNYDIIAEGIHGSTCYEKLNRLSFIHLWNSINEKRGYGWSTNPYVWVVEFKKINYEGEK